MLKSKTTIYFFNFFYRKYTIETGETEMALLDLIPEKARERIERKGTHKLMVSAFLNLAMELIESGEADAILNGNFDNENNNKGVPEPIPMKGIGKI